MTDWIKHNGGPQPVGDDVWVCIDAMPDEMEEVGAGYVRLPKQVGSWKHVTGFFIINQHLINAARLEGIREGLEAAAKEVVEWECNPDVHAIASVISALNSETIAKEADNEPR